MNNIVILFLTVIGILSRLLPHPPNFTPVSAVGLFGGAFINSRWVSFLLPILIMFVSDLILGFHTLMPTIYGLMLINVIIGHYLKDNVSVLSVGSASLLSSTIFFLGSNFMVWLGSGYHPQDLNGLLMCYVMALPFFHYTVLGDLFYCMVLFGSWSWVSSRIEVKTSGN